MSKSKEIEVLKARIGEIIRKGREEGAEIPSKEEIRQEIAQIKKSTQKDLAAKKASWDEAQQNIKKEGEPKEAYIAVLRAEKNLLGLESAAEKAVDKILIIKIALTLITHLEVIREELAQAILAKDAVARGVESAKEWYQGPYRKVVSELSADKIEEQDKQPDSRPTSIDDEGSIASMSAILVKKEKIVEKLQEEINKEESLLSEITYVMKNLNNIEAARRELEAAQKEEQGIQVKLARSRKVFEEALIEPVIPYYNASKAYTDAQEAAEDMARLEKICITVLEGEGDKSFAKMVLGGIEFEDDA